jgi:hypothetical protein
MGLALATRRTLAEEVRTMAHDALDAWLDGREADAAEGATLREISERFLQTRSALLSVCLEAVIRQQYAKALQQTEAECTCGRRIVRRRFDAKEVSTLQGTITVSPVLLLRSLRAWLASPGCATAALR